MNKTYKLYGTIWDALETTCDIKYMDDDDYINNFDETFNLFDNNNTRKINISYLLKINDNQNLNKIVDLLGKYSNVLLNIDYIPCDNVVVREFYYKRVIQIYNYLVNHLDNSIVYLSSNIKDQLKTVQY